MTNDYTPEEWLAALATEEAELNPRIEHPSPEFETRVELATAKLEIEHHLAASLKDLRKFLGLTQMAVATKWGRQQSQVSKIERSPENAEVATLAGYVEALGGGSITVTIKVANKVFREDIVVGTSTQEAQPVLPLG